MAALADGSVLYTIMVNDFSDPGNGIWLLDADGEMTHLMPGADDQDYPAPGIVDVRVTDDGAAPQSADGTFRVNVVGPLEILGATREGDQWTITWRAVSGLRYRLISADTVSGPEWTPLPGEVTAAGDTAPPAPQTP